jgi:hypothetical protein
MQKRIYVVLYGYMTRNLCVSRFRWRKVKNEMNNEKNPNVE